MSKSVLIKNKISQFNKIIKVSGDKSISIRWVLFASLANGVSKARNLLRSEDVLSSIEAIKKLGIKVTLSKKLCTIYGKGPSGYKFKKNLVINAKNSGTLGRIILGILVNTPETIPPITITNNNKLGKAFIKVLKTF